MNLCALMMVLVIGVSTTAAASFDLYEFDSPQQEAQYRVLIEELRCPKCQNQNLAGSDAPIAQDLKQKPMKWSKMAVVMLKFVIICLSVMETLSAISRLCVHLHGFYGFSTHAFITFAVGLDL